MAERSEKDAGNGRTPRPKYPPTERGVRVRFYPNAKQAEWLSVRCMARATLWNLIVDVFERSYARHKGEPAGGLTIKCNRAALEAETLRHRGTEQGRWLRALSVWTCKRVVGQAFAARSRTFEGTARHPRRHPVRATGGGTWCTAYDGRKSDGHYVPDKALHLCGVGVLRLATGAGHMPASMTRRPTVTVTRDAVGRWFLSFAVEAPGGAARWRAACEEAPAPSPGEAICESDVLALDGGLKALLHGSDGSVEPTSAQARREERRARVRRSASSGHAKAKASGKTSDGGLRKRKRAEKQRAIAWKYKDDGPIGRLRAASKAEHARKRKEAAAHAAAEREKKRLATTEGERTSTQGETPKAKPARKTRHKGKGSGSGRRRPRRKSPCARKGRRLDRTVARRKRGSKRREDARVRRARHHAHIADHRREHNHRASARCIARACALGIESLALAGLARGPLGKALLEAGLGMLLFQLVYKALWNDIPLVKCPRHYPSSQLCSHCGYQHRGLKLSDREWTCPQCGTRHHRDFNACANIKDYTIATLRSEGRTITTNRTHRSGETVACSRTPERPGSVQHHVAGEGNTRTGTARDTSNRERVTEALSGTAPT